MTTIKTMAVLATPTRFDRFAQDLVSERIATEGARVRSVFRPSRLILTVFDDQGHADVEENWYRIASTMEARGLMFDQVAVLDLPNGTALEQELVEFHQVRPAYPGHEVLEAEVADLDEDLVGIADDLVLGTFTMRHFTTTWYHSGRTVILHKHGHVLVEDATFVLAYEHLQALGRGACVMSDAMRHLARSQVLTALPQE